MWRARPWKFEAENNILRRQRQSPVGGYIKTEGYRISLKQAASFRESLSLVRSIQNGLIIGDEDESSRNCGWAIFPKYAINFCNQFTYFTTNKNIPISGSLLHISVPSKQGVPYPSNVEEIAAGTKMGFSADRHKNMSHGISQSQTTSMFSGSFMSDQSSQGFSSPAGTITSI